MDNTGQAAMTQSRRAQRLIDKVQRPSLMKMVVVAVASVIVSGLLGVPAVAHADACVNGTVKRGGSGGDYLLCQAGAWLHVVPTFDPNSADGYGPNQPLPPLCVRYPDQYTCPTNGPPPDAGGTGF